MTICALNHPSHLPVLMVDAFALQNDLVLISRTEVEGWGNLLASGKRL